MSLALVFSIMVRPLRASHGSDVGCPETKNQVPEMEDRGRGVEDRYRGLEGWLRGSKIFHCLVPETCVNPLYLFQRDHR